jgi:hypothetical protein
MRMKLVIGCGSGSNEEGDCREEKVFIRAMLGVLLVFF